MKILHYDCFSGISGDMNLGAMIDLGIDEKDLCQRLESLNIKEDYSISFSKDSKKGIYGTRVIIRTHDTPPHRAYSDIKEIISNFFNMICLYGI